MVTFSCNPNVHYTCTCKYLLHSKVPHIWSYCRNEPSRPCSIVKIYNYTNIPCVYKGSSIESQSFYIPDSALISTFGKYYQLKHNGNIIADEETDCVVISANTTGTGYVYEKISFPVPDINLSLVTLFTFFGFYFMVRIIQKIRTR